MKNNFENDPTQNQRKSIPESIEIPKKRILLLLEQNLYLGLPIVLLVLVIFTAPWNVHRTEPVNLPHIPTILPAEPPRLHYIASEGDQLEEVAFLLHTSSEKLSQTNGISTDQRLMIAQDLTIPILPEEWVDPAPTRSFINTSLLRPLSDRSSIGDILNKMRASSSLWKTAWFDIYKLDYGLPGYTGTPLLSHKQVWVSQPGSVFLISQSPGENPLLRNLIRDGLSFNFIQGWGIQAQRILPEHELEIDSWILTQYRSEGWDPSGVWEVLRSEVFADQQTVVVDWTPEKDEHPAQQPIFLRLWIDALTGVILRQQIFATDSSPILIQDTFTKRVNFDIDLPQSIFDPFQASSQGFARNYTGEPASIDELQDQAWLLKQKSAPGHEPLQWLLPPKGYDPSAQRLTFQFQNQINLGPANLHSVELYAGEYFLTWLPIFDPWSVHCTRSLDGKKIAYANSSMAGWLDLTAPEHFHGLMNFGQVLEVAFSPDGRYLAFSTGNVYILDTTSGKTESMGRFQNATSLAWSPDSHSLALIAKTSQIYHAYIVDIGTGMFTYATPIDTRYAWGTLDAPAEWPAANWPGHDWGIEYPVQPARIDGCNLP